MTEASKMPARIWITMEDHAASWAGSFKRWHASDLDHGDEYPVYIRADIAEQMAEALRKIEYASRKGSLCDHERLQSVRTTVCAALSAWEASNPAILKARQVSTTAQQSEAQSNDQ